MKKYLIYIIILGIISTIISGMFIRIKRLNKELDLATNNVKAYQIENSTLIDKNIAFKFTVDQLSYLNDSLILKMKQVANDNKIKDKKIKSLQYELEHFEKRDTIFIRDTIFKEPDFILDTCITDKWNSSCIHLEYPNKVVLNNTYNNEKYIILHSHKEPIKPRKWFLPRWFTKKQTIVEVEVIDENPYVVTKKQRFVEIIK